MADTTNTPMPTTLPPHLHSAVTAAVTSYQQQVRDQEEQERREQKRLLQQEYQIFMNHITQDIAQAPEEQRTLFTTHTRITGKRGNVSLFFYEDDPVTHGPDVPVYRITYNNTLFTRGLAIKAGFLDDTGERLDSYRESLAERTCAAESLLQELFLTIAAFHQYLEEKEQEAKKEREEDARQQASIVQRLEQAEQEKAERRARHAHLLAEARAEDARLHAEMDRLVEQAKQTLWTWPKGITLRYYLMEYQKGGVFVEESSTIQAEYSSCYTLTDTLDEQGYIRVASTDNPRVWNERKFDSDRHLPVWIRYTASSIEELHVNLIEEVRVSLPNVQRVFLTDEQGNAIHDEHGEQLFLLARLPDAAYEPFKEPDYHGPYGCYHSDDYSEAVGRLPVKEIRDFLDTQR